MEGEARPVRGRAEGRKEPDCACRVQHWHRREADPSRPAGRGKVTPGGWKCPGNSDGTRGGRGRAAVGSARERLTGPGTDVPVPGVPADRRSTSTWREAESGCFT